MRPFGKIFIIAGLAFLFRFEACAAVDCKVRFMDGREMACQDGAVCVFQGVPSWMSCRCKSPGGYGDCLPVKISAGPVKRDQFLPPGDGEEDVPLTPGARVKAAAEYRRSGMAGYRAGDYNWAIMDWNKAIALNPDLNEELTPALAKAYARRGTARYRAAEYDKAAADFAEALKLDPDADDMRRALALAGKARQNAPLNNFYAGPAPKARAPAAAVKKEDIPKDQFLRFLLFIAAWLALALIGLFAAGFVNYSEVKGDGGPSRTAVNSYGEFVRKFSAGLTLKTGALIWLGGFFGLLSFFYYYFLLKWLWGEISGKGKSGFVLDLPPLDVVSRPRVLPRNEPVSETLEQARRQVAEGNYEAALETLSTKPYTQLDLNYYNLFLEVYIHLGDFSRARLMLTQISREIHDKSGAGRDYALYLALASACGDRGEGALARQLREAAVAGMIKSVSVREAPQELYSLATALENAGEADLARKLYKVFVDAGHTYLDAKERFEGLKAKAEAPAPAPQASVRQAPKTAAQVIGQVLDGRFEVRNDLGEGAMGIVYEGWDRRQNGKVAIKKMHSWLKAYPEEYGRFKQEAEIVGRLKHPNIVGVRAVIEADGEIYLIFDYVDGKPASVVLKERKRFPLKECKEIFKGVCAAVSYAHKNNVIHRDLKPSNIMLDSAFRAMVVDFGLASELRESLTRVTHQTMSGTPAYMAPEQHLGIVKREADIYAMGVCLYEMLSGELPFRGPDTMKLKKEKDYREVTSLFPWLPGGVDQLLARALEPEPSQRIDDALDFYDELKDL